MEKFTFVVSEEGSNLPLKKIIKAKYHFSSRLMTKIKYRDLLMLNGEKVPGYVVPKVGDTVTVSIPDETSYFEPENIPIHVIYEDDDLLVINKAPGITCHPTNGHKDHTLANAIMYYMQESNQSFKIRFINRLDMDTSGALMIGKNGFVQAEIIKQMDNNLTEKKYIALVDGKLDEERIISLCNTFGLERTVSGFIIDLPIGRAPEGGPARKVLSGDTPGAYPSTTKVSNIRTFDGYSEVELELLTGRTHQIRVHLSHLGHPILGDDLYRGPLDKIKRQALHAKSFSFIHPITKERLTIEAPIPEDMKALLFP